MAETKQSKKTKLIDGPVYFNGPLESLPHYNKFQIITCTCESCKKQFTIKYQNLRKKTNMLCKSCGVKLHTPYESNGAKISKAHKTALVSMSEKEKYDRFVAPQLNRSEEEKKKSIESYKSTIRSKSQENINAMRSKMRAAKAAMTDEQKKEREKKFLKSFYESQGEKIRVNAKKMFERKNISAIEKNDFVYECTCSVCHNKWLWSPIKKSNYHTIYPFCPKCFKDNRSKYEDKICQILDELEVKYLKNDRKVLNGKELDIYVPESKFAIEFDGIYWHNNSHKTYDKYVRLQELGISLMNIFESEFDYDKVKSILSAKFHKSQMLYARKCEIREISNLEYKDFCESNHIQNYAVASVRLGLFCNNELMQIMSFSKARFSRKYEWEIIRECSKNGYGIVGGKEKLFRYFLRLYNPSSIVSYCDKRWFNGESYLKLGMKQLKDSGPSFIYTNGKITCTRMQCQKYKLREKLSKFDEKLTEYENMLANGYYRMYDFGQHVFVWEKEWRSA